jgi:hypothetical protein
VTFVTASEKEIRGSPKLLYRPTFKKVNIFEPLKIYDIGTDTFLW